MLMTSEVAPKPPMAAREMPQALRRLAGVFALALCAVLPGKSWATCSMNPGVAILNFSFGSKAIDTNVAVGESMGEIQSTLSMAGPSSDGTCTKPFNVFFEGIGAPVNNVYPTTLPGVGVRMQWVNMPPYGYFPQQTPVGAPFYNAGYTVTVNGGAIVKIELIKTSAVVEGGLLSGEFAKWTMRDGDGAGLQYVSMRFTAPIPITPIYPTCSVDLPDIAVDLGSASAGDFANVGDVKAAKNFDVKLTCGGGNTGSTSSLKMAMTDQLQNANTSTELTTRQASGDATGVAIQILRNGTPLKYGPPPTLGTEPNVFSLGITLTPTTGAVTVPLSARFIRPTSTPVTAGTVNAVALYTVLYN